MTIDQLIAELNVIRETCGGDTHVYLPEDEFWWEPIRRIVMIPRGNPFYGDSKPCVLVG